MTTMQLCNMAIRHLSKFLLSTCNFEVLQIGSSSHVFCKLITSQNVRFSFRFQSFQAQENNSNLTFVPQQSDANHETSFHDFKDCEV